MTNNLVELKGVRINYVTTKYKYNCAVNFCNRFGVKLFEPKCKASNDKLNELANKHIKLSSFWKEFAGGLLWTYIGSHWLTLAC